jgi:hypothetical protein
MSNLPPELDEGMVYYCKSCHSLCVIIDPAFESDAWDGSYCGKCYSADIGVCTFEEWLEEENRRRKKQEELEWKK